LRLSWPPPGEGDHADELGFHWLPCGLRVSGRNRDQDDRDRGKLGPWLATMVVAGGMIGSGVYLLPASLAAFGSVSLLGWLLAGLGAALFGGVFSMLAILRPDGHGFFPAISEALGPGVGFVAGLLYWFPVSNIPVALAVTGYLSYFFPQIASGLGSTMATVAIVWLFVGANWIGARFVARLGGWTLGVGLVPILAVALGGWLIFKPAIFLASWNVSGHGALAAVPQSAVIAFWAFVGVENALILAPLVRDPARNVPLATFGGLGIAAGVYLAASAVIMGILPAAVLARSSAPFADAMTPLLGASLGGGIALCALLKASGTLGTGILITAETAESDAVMGQILPGRPPRRAEIAPKLNLVLMGLIMSAVVIASASPTLARQFTIVTNISVVLIMLAFLAACLSLIRLSLPLRGPRRALAVALAVAGALFCGGMIASSERQLLVWALGAIIAASLAWLPVWLRRRSLEPLTVAD
jgi:arginine:agmatine antiporter